MKSYQKPTMDVTSYNFNETISSLAQWLQDNGSVYSEANIVTFEVVS